VVSAFEFALNRPPLYSQLKVSRSEREGCEGQFKIALNRTPGVQLAQCDGRHLQRCGVGEYVSAERFFYLFGYAVKM
jgi:hypothetical protein